jgi:serine/threonine protein kinase/tetratricopeptide (TPR) repeat protein
MGGLTPPSGYTRQGPLGVGGTAEVFRAYSEKLRREVALKLPLPDAANGDMSFVTLARRELKLIGYLNHPGLVRILDISTDEPGYIALELCHGPTLDSQLPVTDLLKALNLLSAIAVDLEFLRLNNLVHGDFKPHNIFLPANWDDYGENDVFFVKLSDFSLGCRVDEPASARAGLGTVGYLAPETITDSRVSHQSDLFALGVIAYQVFAGVHPFMQDETDPVKINSRCREEEPPPLSEFRNDLPAKALELVKRLLAKNETNRPSSGWEVCRTLREAGATYPYEKILHPSWLVDFRAGFTDNVDRLLKLTDRQTDRLAAITNGDLADLRLALSINYRRGDLIYDGERFVFPREIYWPHHLRKRTLTSFSQVPLTKKKTTVLIALVGDVAIAEAIGLIDGDEAKDIEARTVMLLRPLLSSRIYRRLCPSLAERAAKSKQSAAAARLYVQAGDLPKSIDCAYDAAQELHQQHRSSEALSLIDHVVSFGQLLREEFSLRRLLMVYADILKNTGELVRGEQVYLRIARLYERHPTDRLLAETYKDLGDLYRMKQEITNGLDSLQKAMDIYQEHDDELEVSHTLNNMGNIHWISGDMAAALAEYAQALRIQRRLKAVPEIASTLSNIGSIYAIQGRMDRSIRLLTMSLNLKRELGDLGEIARTLNNLGYVYQITGAIDKAVECLEESLQINRRLDTKKEILYNLENISSLMIDSGRLKESVKYLREGLSLANEIGDKPHTGSLKLNMATVLSRLGRLAEAEKWLDEVDRIFLELGDKIAAVMARTCRAGIVMKVGDVERATDLATQAADTARELNAKPEQLNALLLLTRLQTNEAVHRTARALANELGLKREKLLLQFNRMESLLIQGDLKTASELGREIVPRLNSIDADVELARMNTIAAELKTAEGEPGKALALSKKAVDLAQQSDLALEKIAALSHLAKLQMSQKEFEACFANYQQALKLSQYVAKNLRTDADRATYQNTRQVQLLVSEITRLSQILSQKQTVLT